MNNDEEQSEQLKYIRLYSFQLWYNKLIDPLEKLADIEIEPIWKLGKFW